MCLRQLDILSMIESGNDGRKGYAARAVWKIGPCLVLLATCHRPLIVLMLLG